MKREFKKLEIKIAEIAKTLSEIQKYAKDEKLKNTKNKLVDFVKFPAFFTKELGLKGELGKLNNIELKKYEKYLKDNKNVKELFLLEKVLLAKKEIN